MADTSVLAPQQHKQPSRKGKKAWRKNVDITEVNEGLEVVRDEVIRGGIVAEKASTDLFIEDTAGAGDVQKAYNRKHKPLKAGEILAQRSAVPGVNTHKRPADSKVTDGLLEPGAKRTKKDYISAKEYERLRKMAYGGDTVKKDIVQQGGDAAFDPWAVTEPVKRPEFSFLEEKKARREPETLKHAPVTMAKNGKAIRAVSKPEAGKSYNPAFDDWRALIDREGGKAVEEEMKRLEDEAKEAEKQALIARAQADEERDRDSQWESEWESEWEGILSEREEEKNAEWLKKKRPERKTPAERNKIKRRKTEQARKVHEEKMRTREEELKHAKALARAADAKQRALGLRASALPDSDADSSDGEDVELRRRRIGKAVIPDAPLEVVLTDELQDSLRRLKPEGNLLKDRFRSMILRGKIESRTPITQPKQPKTEVTEKWSYKDWTLK